MASIIQVGRPYNEAERQAIAYLHAHLPATCTVIHNFEIAVGREVMEIDLAVLTPHCVYLVDVKGVRGTVDIYGAKWYPEGREPYTSPLFKGRQNAKILKAYLVDNNRAQPDMQRIYVQAAVLLTAPDALIVDHNADNRDANAIVPLKKSLAYFMNPANVPTGRLNDIRPLLPAIERTITGGARRPAVTYRDWRIEEKLGGNERYSEYRAHHLFIKKGASRLRVYRADPYQDEEARTRERRLISNAYRAVTDLPGHPNVLSVREFFGSEDGSYFVLVTEDVHGYALRQHVRKPTLALTFDQKLRVLRDVLTALKHIHSYQVIHRNLTPDAILISADGHARLASFEYARAAANGASTIAPFIGDDLEKAYQAPECFGDPSQASVASDLFSAGLVFYELLTGEQAFTSPTQIYDHSAIFPVKPHELKPDLPAGLDEWLQKLCAFEPQQRFASAAEARLALDRLVLPATAAVAEAPDKTKQDRPSPAVEPVDKRNLPREFPLGNRFVVQERLGQGGFAVAYKVFDSLAGVMRVIKLVLTDRISVSERLRQEYRTLSKLPDHPYVVKVWWADYLADGTPYIVFDYVDGLDVEEMVQNRSLSPEDAVRLASQVTEGLAHMHAHGVYHQDIKPSNLLWTDRGVRIIDFNVAVSDDDSGQMRGGTGRYIPPDLERVVDLSSSQKIDRDIYALGITLYECITGQYPFAEPRVRKTPIDPRTVEDCADLSQDLVAFLYKAIAPNASERFTTAQEMRTALEALLSNVRQAPPQRSEVALVPLALSQKPNYNPYVTRLLTFYSQSRRTNAGTRGLDEMGEQVYVATLLDNQLQPAILSGDFQLVIISGNAGDGKTAFIQRLARSVEREGVSVQYQVNGYTFTRHGHRFLSNYDGSQDEGERTNEEVLLEFLAPFEGADERHWPANETRLIAINEGRLVDFLTERRQRFPRLAALVQDGLNGVLAAGGVVVINLNLRAVIADLEAKDDSIFDRLLRGLTRREFWQACEQCDLRQRCYIYHNARTFMDPTAGPRTIERLKTLYTITHLRGQLHMTLRDLRSALAYTLVGTRDCDEVHQLYQQGTPEAMQAILDGFYFNAWMGGSADERDRLLQHLREIDIAEVSNPELDRNLGFLEPAAREMARFTYAGRGRYDDELFNKLFAQLPREYSEKSRARNFAQHKSYLAMLRRRHYFERRDDHWSSMLPYQHFGEFSMLIKGEGELNAQVDILLQAINRGEGLVDPARLGRSLALRVRRVERGTIQSYRLFEGSCFTLLRRETGESTRFIEYLPQALYLQYQAAGGHQAELRVNLDIYEMLMRLNHGYRPSPEELQGFYLNLIIFKNVLASAPYQEVLLTETGHEFYRVSRKADGTLAMESVQ